MKRKPTLNEKKLLARIGLDPAMWLVRKNNADGMILQHRHTDAEKYVPAGMLEKGRR